jgi:hypothetical protein
VLFAVALVVAAGLSALAIDAVLGGTAAAPPSVAGAGDPRSPTPTTTPSVAPVAPAEPGAYRFLNEWSQGPVRWDPCDPITYAIDARAAPRWVVRDLAKAMREVTAATGIRFEPSGRTSEDFVAAFERIRFSSQGSDLVILWVGNERYEEIRERLGARRPSLAFAMPLPGDYATRGQYVGAIVVMSEGTFSSPYQQGFRYRYSHGVVLLHELGHVMGLGHVRKDDEQLMHTGGTTDWDLTTFGSGDLEGLRLLGAEQGCFARGS